MKQFQLLSAKWQYAIYGALFGLSFPIVATFIDIISRALPLNFSSILEVHQSQPLLWVINLAPLILGIFAAFAGIKQDELLKLNQNLEQTVREKTADLIKTNEELKNFSYIVSHDLKAPLRGISTLAMFIEEDMGKEVDEMIRENFDLLKGRVKRMETLINGILEYSRIGRMNNTLSDIDLRPELEKIIDFIDPHKTAKIHLPNHLPVIRGNHVRVHQVFQNLISNAIKYSDKEVCEIWIECQEFNDYFEFRVRDNGPGIPPKHHSKVFSLFQTLQSKDSYESTGIGLTIVQKIIHDQNGTIWIESETGAGATFAFTWKKGDIQTASSKKKEKELNFH